MKRTPLLSKRSPRCMTCIDVSICSNYLVNSILSWSAQFSTGSDHALISFQLALATPPTFDYVDTNTAAYNASLASKSWSSPSVWSCRILDKEALALQHLLYETWIAHSRLTIKPTIPLDMLKEDHLQNTLTLASLPDSGSLPGHKQRYNTEFHRTERLRFQGSHLKSRNSVGPPSHV